MKLKKHIINCQKKDKILCVFLLKFNLFKVLINVTLPYLWSEIKLKQYIVYKQIQDHLLLKPKNIECGKSHLK